MVSSRLVFILFPLILGANDSFEAYKKMQDNDFKREKVKFIDFKREEDAAFKSHLEKEKNAILNYKRKVKTFWLESDLEDAKKLTNYSKDLHTKSLVDFENNQIIISKISAKKRVTKEELLKELNHTLNLTTKQAYQQNILEQNINYVIPDSKYIKKAKLDKGRLLHTGAQEPALNSEDISLSKKGDVYKLTYKFPKNSTYRRSFDYLPQAKSNATRFNLKANLLLAIMHSESSFNPLARSHIPAFGLMQIVPHSAGIDSYKFLYKKRRLLSASYLYNTKNNIEIGSAYFHILYYKYLSSIKDPQSRLYCAIAGYNTGAGNVAWAFTHNKNVKKAAQIINKMSAQKVYRHLQKNLKYDEPKHYLKRVNERSIRYKELYRL